jgi:hypothetical protein
MEVWTPSPDGLRFGTGVYQEMDVFKSASAGVTFAYGQGLPGQVLAQGAPLIFEDLTAERGFVRSELARISHLTAGVGLPVQHNGSVTAVITLFLSLQAGSAGAVEVWTYDDVEGHLGLSAGYYNGIQAFEEVSRRRVFRPGEGLPGQVFAAKAPVLFEELSSERGFLRAGAAADAGLTAGIGIPVFERSAVRHVLLLLNASASPLARVMEIWRPRKKDGVLKLEAGYFGDLNAFEEATRRITFAPGVGLPGQVLSSKAPVLFEHLSRHSQFLRAEAAARAGLTAALGFPVFSGRSLRAVVVLFI